MGRRDGDDEGVATVTLAGSVMLSATPDSDDAFELVSFTVMVEAPPAIIEVGFSVVAEVGADSVGSPSISI